MGKASKREATAYHEAGHAACCLLLQRSFIYVTIKPDPADNSLGHIRHRHSRVNWEKMQEGWYFGNLQARRWAETQAMIAAAGGIAEHLYRGRHNHLGAAKDYSSVVGYLEQLSGTTEETGAYWSWINQRTRTLLSSRFHWFVIEKLAAALLEQETVTYREAKIILKQADTEFMVNCASQRTASR